MITEVATIRSRDSARMAAAAVRGAAVAAPRGWVIGTLADIASFLLPPNPSCMLPRVYSFIHLVRIVRCITICFNYTTFPAFVNMFSEIIESTGK
jgi:hypothetical protein